MTDSFSIIKKINSNRAILRPMFLKLDFQYLPAIGRTPRPVLVADPLEGKPISAYDVLVVT